MKMLWRAIFIYSIIFNYCYANEVFLPKTTGLYSVGTKTIELVDNSRTMLRDNSSRKLIGQIFYPSTQHKGKYYYMPETIKDGMIQDTKVFSYAKPNVNILESHKYPLIIFIPGLGAIRQKYTILCEELASHGYIILSLDQPYVGSFVKFTNGEIIVPTLKDIWKVRKDREYRYQYYDEAMSEAIKDVKYILNNIKKINDNDFNGVCDIENIILMGHSFGGNVAHTLGFKDQRIKAIVDIDSKITERKVFGRIGVPPNKHGKPALFIRGAMQYQEDVGNQLTEIKNSTVWDPMVEHSAFSDKAYFAANIPDFGNKGIIRQFFNWLFKIEPYWDKVDTNIGDINIDNWYMQYRQYILLWLNDMNHMHK